MLVGERWDVEIPAKPLKICLLDGQWQSLTAASPCCRLFVRGPEVEVAELVAGLSQTFPLALPAVGLDKEAMAFAHGETPVAHRTGTPRLGDGLTTEQGFVEIVSHLTEIIVFWQARVPQAKLPDPSVDHELREPVHQMRVALRRLRSAFRAFRAPMSCAKLQELKPDIQRLAQMLGPPRDWDVFISETLNEVIAALPNEPSLKQLRRAALRRRHDAYGTLNRYLAGDEFSRLTVSLACLTLQKPWGLEADDMLRAAQHMPLATFGAHILRRRHHQILAKGGRLLDDANQNCAISELHSLRLQCKQLRYLAEFFAPLFASKTVTRFTRRLADLQGSLGHLNDAAVAAELMTSLPTVTRRAQGIVQGFIAGRIGDRRSDVAATWKRFRTQDEFC